MSDITLPRRAADRIALAHQTGYLLTSSNCAGLSHWLDQCRLRYWPFVCVIKDRRAWRVMVELDRWRFTGRAEQILTAIATEHGAQYILAGHDFFRATRLPLWPAERIASQINTWARVALAELQAVTE